MPIGLFLDQVATVIHLDPTQGSTDSYNNPVAGEGDITEGDFPAYLEQEGLQEELSQAAAISDYLLVLGPNEAGELPKISTGDIVVIEDLRYVVSTRSRRLRTIGGDEHVQTHVREAIG